MNTHHITQPFITPVNEHGIPKRIMLGEPTGQETFFLESKDSFTHHYWNLRSLKLQYTYTINGAQFQREFEAIAPLEPFQRILEGPAFLHTSTDEEKTHTYFFFPMHTTSFCHERGYGLKLDLTETEADSEFILTTLPQDNMPLNATKEITIFGTTIQVYLYTKDPTWKASIDHIQITEVKWKYLN